MSKTCANCGAEVPEGASFCDNCGMPVSEAPREEVPPREVPVAQQAPAASPPSPPPVEQSVADQPSSREALRWGQPPTRREEAPPGSAPSQPASPSLPPPSPVKQPPISASPPPRQDGRTPRGGLLVLGGGLTVALLVIGIAVWALVPDAQDGVTPEEASEPAPGYQLVEHDSGSLSAQVPSEWETTTREDDILTGSPPASEDESVGPSIVAATDLDAFENRSEDSPSEVRGMYLLASRELAQRFTDDLLVASGPNDYSDYCESGAREDFNRAPYSGRMQAWDCGDNTLLTLAVAPENRECVVVAQIPTYNEADAEAARHILETFEVNCEGIP